MTYFARRAVTVALAVGALSVVTSGPAWADATPGERCAAAKIKVAAKNASAQLNCLARSIVNPDFDIDTCQQKAMDAQQAAFARAEAAAEKNGGCATIGDADDIELDVEDFVDTLDIDLPSE